MFGNISNMYKGNFTHHHVSYTKPYLLPYKLTKQKQLSRKLFVAAHGVINTSMTLTSLACSAKAFSFIFTYPFETCKIYNQLNKEPKSVNDLYQGFNTFIILATFQCFINYNFFFALINALSPYHSQHMTYLVASTISCFMTSIIKVPLTYISRNIIFIKNKNGFDAFCQLASKIDKTLYHKSWLTNLLSDIPDSFIKFFINSQLLLHMPYINNFSRSCITGIVTSVVNMPLDYMLTQTLCNNIITSHNTQLNKNSFTTRCMSGVQYRIISSMLGNIIFFNIFNALQQYYKVFV
jgi:uncharacterized membrane protein